MRYILSFVLSLILTISYAQNAPVHHNLRVSLDPAKSAISVVDKITFNELSDQNEIEFSMNSNLKITSNSGNVKVKLIKKKYSGKDLGMDRDDSGQEETLLQLNRYRLSFKKNFKEGEEIRISYKGKIESPVLQSEENYQRGFSESPGIISEKGIYLAGSTYWVPQFDEKMVSFELETSMPKGWKTVSQGGRSYEEIVAGKHVDVWMEKSAQEEIFLIAARFHEYSFNAGNVKAMAFLRSPDEALANKYLETTAQYLEMYRQLVGPFPYSKFALVENFWETGYGMPSFTLLGEKIIRFPFILHSSYPHELLHNWWGNSVYVDFETGNWCEGITAYMADHLIKEQRGQGATYRRTTIQKFADYVTEENDFPVNEFLSRHNSSSEAIGYGKVSMIFHMLRQEVGEENFVKAVQRFNRSNAFKIASWEDLKEAFNSVSETSLDAFFDQWTTRAGAPELKLDEVKYKNNLISFSLKQIQKEDAFELDVPILLHTDNGLEFVEVSMFSKEQGFSLRANSNIQKIEVDPMFDLFRILDANEVPASLSKAYGAKKTTFVLPSNASGNEIKYYTDFIESWKKGNSGEFEIVRDADIKTLPVDKTSWILGFTNLFAETYLNRTERHGLIASGNGYQLGEKVIDKSKCSTIITAKHPLSKNEVQVFFSIDKAEAISGLVRKLPHYGKYSYLAFEGDEPTNILKGQWSVLDSPLAQMKKDAELSDNKDGSNEQSKAFLNRRALAYLAPVFSSDRIMEDIKYLASEELKGRGIGTPELDQAAEYIKVAFENAGLQPAAENASYFQNWDHAFKDKGNLKLTNVIGMIPGSDPKLTNEPVVISAHYDHLGLGWPDVHAGDEGKIHYGADDNASGVAIMLELARSMAKTAKPLRPIIFVAFTAEEAGLVGSRFFVKELGKTGKAFANLNLDTNGRLFDKPLLVLNSNTAREWKFIFMGTEYVTGVKTEMVQQQIDASDQVAFNEVGVPAVQLFSGANHDYHRPSDVIEKLDPAGMVKIATVAKEVIAYLGERKDAMPYTGAKIGVPQKQTEQTKSNRRAATGSMPDFAYSGLGVKIGAISDDSPASKAGLKVGDVIISFNGKEVKNLREYSNYLKTKHPGDEVILEVLRKEDKLSMKIVLGER